MKGKDKLHWMGGIRDKCWLVMFFPAGPLHCDPTIVSTVVIGPSCPVLKRLEEREGSRKTGDPIDVRKQMHMVFRSPSSLGIY